MTPRLRARLPRLPFGGRRRLDEDARRELDTHLELLVDRYMRNGMTDAEARAAARRQFGNAALVRDELLDMNRNAAAGLVNDLRA